MTNLEYQKWMQKAFLYVEAALGQELATPGRVCMTEEYFRTSLVRGLVASRPDLAHRIGTENNVPWSTSACGHCATEPGSGRPLQHDIAIMPNGDDAGLLLEAKWVKRSAAKAILQDIWKLILSRGTEPEGQAIRCYLLLGGESEELSNTLRELRKGKVDLRWSNAGRGTTKATRKLDLSAVMKTQSGKNALETLLGWGAGKNRHYRETAMFWQIVNVTRRFDPWVRTVDGIGWRSVLFEIHHHGADRDDNRLDWDSVGTILPEKCGGE